MRQLRLVPAGERQDSAKTCSTEVGSFGVMLDRGCPMMSELKRELFLQFLIEMQSFFWLPSIYHKSFDVKFMIASQTQRGLDVVTLL